MEIETCENCGVTGPEADWWNGWCEKCDSIKPDVKVLEHLTTYCGYDWNAIQIGEDPSGVLFIRYGEGCSCSDINDSRWEPLRDVQHLDEIADQWDRDSRWMDNPRWREVEPHVRVERLAKFRMKGRDLLSGRK